MSSRNDFPLTRRNFLIQIASAGLPNALVEIEVVAVRSK